MNGNGRDPKYHTLNNTQTSFCSIVNSAQSQGTPVVVLRTLRGTFPVLLPVVKD